MQEYDQGMGPRLADILITYMYIEYDQEIGPRPTDLLTTYMSMARE